MHFASSISICMLTLIKYSCITLTISSVYSPSGYVSLPINAIRSTYQGTNIFTTCVLSSCYYNSFAAYKVFIIFSFKHIIHHSYSTLHFTWLTKHFYYCCYFVQFFTLQSFDRLIQDQRRALFDNQLIKFNCQSEFRALINSISTIYLFICA